jgi:hypothetical protein
LFPSSSSTSIGRSPGELQGELPGKRSPGQATRRKAARESAGASEVLGEGAIHGEPRRGRAPWGGGRPRERRRRRVPGERRPWQAPRRASCSREHRRGPSSCSSSRSHALVPEFPKSSGLATRRTRATLIRATRPPPLLRGYCCSPPWLSSPCSRRFGLPAPPTAVVVVDFAP